MRGDTQPITTRIEMKYNGVSCPLTIRDVKYAHPLTHARVPAVVLNAAGNNSFDIFKYAVVGYSTEMSCFNYYKLEKLFADSELTFDRNGDEVWDEDQSSFTPEFLDNEL